MPVRKNNETKEFTIGTKIKYNGKLYEVVEGKYCDNCSIKSFCNASDEYIPISVVPRDKLLNIFGKCSAIDRDDKKSVVFVEVPKDDSKVDSKDNSKYEYYKISPLWAHNNPTQLRPIELVLPSGHEIDVESSDLSKGIIRFRRKWLSLEQLYKLAEENNFNTYRDSIKNISGNKLLALANLMDIARYFNGNWKYDVNKENVGYMIAYDTFVPEPHYSVRKNDSNVDIYYGNPIFKNEDDAKYVISNPNFRVVLDVIFKG